MCCTRSFLALSLLGLIGCAPSAAVPPADTARTSAPIAFGQITTTPTGQCITQTAPQSQTLIITEQIEVTAAVVASDGRILTPAVFRNQSRPATRAIDAGTPFETLCPAEYTPARIATLQRALTARGAYDGAVTGVLDTATDAAIRAFQTPLGFDSTRIARSVAENMGIVPVSDVRPALPDA